MCLIIKIPHRKTFIRRKFYKVLFEFTNPSGRKEYYTPFENFPVQFNNEYTTPIEFFYAEYHPHSAELNIGDGVFHLCTTKKHAKRVALNLGGNLVIARAVVPKNTVIFKDCTRKEVGVTKVIYTKII